jgi:hypothetical protein
MAKKPKTERLIYEDGTIAYTQPGHEFRVIKPDGGEPKVIDRQPAPRVEEHPETQRAVRLRRGGWQVRDKTTQELVDDGVITVAEAERRARRGR